MSGWTTPGESDRTYLGQALLYSAESTSSQLMHLKSIADSTRGVLFLGTPHAGSSKAQWGYIAASFLSSIRQTNKELLKRLKTDDPRLIHLQDRFANFLHTREQCGPMLHITCAFEERPLAGVGKVIIFDVHHSLGVLADDDTR